MIAQPQCQRTRETTRLSVLAHKSPLRVNAKPSLEDLLGEAGHGMLLQHLGAEEEVVDEKQQAKLEKRQAKKEKLKARKAMQKMVLAKERRDRGWRSRTKRKEIGRAHV